MDKSSESRKREVSNKEMTMKNQLFYCTKQTPLYHCPLFGLFYTKSPGQQCYYDTITNTQVTNQELSHM